MSADRVRALEGFVLGESWVVPPKSSGNEQKEPAESEHDHSKDQHGPAQGDKDKPKGSDSEYLGSSSSTISGPELIMPSICEAPIPETSWVAPELRARVQSSVRKRRKRVSAEESLKNKTKRKKDITAIAEANTDISQEDKEEGRVLVRASKKILDWSLERLVRPGINLFLITAILHVLVFPELIYQHPSLCGIPSVSDYYPTSCAQYRHRHHPHHYDHHPQAHNSVNVLPSRYESITASQRQLESVFNKALHAIGPLDNSLKQSESMLRDVQKELRRVYPGVRNALDFEFQGCWQTTRTAAQEFDSLKADMQSAIDSLIAAGALQKAEQDRQPKLTSRNPQGGHRHHHHHHSEVARATRLSAQMLRREQYLERLRSRMRSKADSLSSDFATLNDHLESIETIVDREGKYRQQQKHLPSNQSFVGNGLRAVFDSLLSGVPQKLHSVVRPSSNSDYDGDTTSTDIPEQSVSRLLQDAANHHHPVMDLTQNLSRQLQGLQAG